MKISRMLEEYPVTLKVLIEFSPHFNKLNNKILRKTLASRVNIQQAAGLAGVELTQLLIKLNNAVNEKYIEIAERENEMEEIFNRTEKPVILKNLSEEKTYKLDVRPTISSGKDPFLDIMATVKNLKTDEVLHLVNSFEPLPLYTVMKNKGFEHWTEKDGNLFNVYFFAIEDSQKQIMNAQNENERPRQNYEKVIEIDVRGLEPPEPMIKVLESLSSIDEETVLLVHHHREPAMLYPKLEERGYSAIANKIEENYYKVVITKKKADQ